MRATRAAAFKILILSLSKDEDLASPTTPLSPGQTRALWINADHAGHTRTARDETREDPMTTIIVTGDVVAGA